MQKITLVTKALRPAKFFLMLAGVLSLLALSYVVYSYAWTGQRQSTGVVLLYYVVPAVLVIILFAALWLKPAYQIIVAICAFSLAASAYGVELFLQVSDPTSFLSQKPIMTLPANERKRMAAKLTKQFGVEIDTRDRHQVIADLREQSIDAVAQTVFPLLERQNDNSLQQAISIHGRPVMPLAGIANKVAVVCNETGEYLIYKSDKHGFHNPSEIWQFGQIDIVAVGNSLTLGACVSSEQNFVALIRRRHPATLNLGMPGEGPLHILAILKEYGLFLKPKVVLWFYAEANTFTELQYEKQSRILMSYLTDDFMQGLLERQSDIDQAITGDIPRQTAMEISRQTRTQEKSNKIVDKLLAFIKLSAVREKLGLVYAKAPQELEKLSESEAAELEVDLNLLRDILSKASARVSAWGGTLYFVYLPGWGHYAKSPDSGVKARTRVLDVVNNLGIPLIDIYSAFQAHADPLSLFPFRGPGRYNEEGHALVAETVLNVISHRHPKDFQPPDSSGSVSEG